MFIDNSTFWWTFQSVIAKLKFLCMTFNLDVKNLWKPEEFREKKVQIESIEKNYVEIQFWK